MRVCDWIAQFLFNRGIERIHGLMGGGASGLNDGFIKHGKIRYICYHHEQGAGHAAIGESKYTGNFSVVNPTTGCGGTNCATSVLNAWQDSVPVLFVSGNVKLNTCSGEINKQRNINIRKYGIQEHHIVDTYKTMTKFSHFITNVNEVKEIFEKAIEIAMTGRKGPVWIDIPGDIQTSLLENSGHILSNFWKDSTRPLVLAGYGIRQSNTVDLFRRFILRHNVPYVSTYGARDYFEHEHPLNIGTVGIKGSRAGNFALQNCDALLVLGSSLGASVIGYDPSQFSPCSSKLIVDCDYDELNKNNIGIYQTLNVDLKEFFGDAL